MRIVAAFTSGTSSLAALAHQWHLTPGEVARVVASQPHVAAPDIAPEVRVPRGSPPRCCGTCPLSGDRAAAAVADHLVEVTTAAQDKDYDPARYEPR